jgi:transposase
MCPGQYESAGKSRSGRARHGNSWLQRHLAVAAMAAARTKDSYFASQYARLVRTRGKPKARKAVGHSMLVAIWHMLEAGVPYQELGADWFEQRNSPDRRARRHLADLKSLGWTMTDTPEGVILTRPQPAAA